MAATSRAPLSRDRILQAALELVDDGGIESLSMRKLGQKLGFEAMSLYNHVANKDDLIDGILDLVLAEGELPAPDGDWDTAVRASAISVHAALQRHPWACSLVMARMEYMNALLSRLREAGFSADETYHAYHVLDGHIFGYSLYETSHSYSDKDAAEFEASLDQFLPPDAYPYLNEHGRQHLSEGPHREVSAFAFGLDLILDGLRKMH